MILNEQSMELVNLVKEFVDNEIIPMQPSTKRRTNSPKKFSIRRWIWVWVRCACPKNWAAWALTM